MVPHHTSHACISCHDHQKVLSCLNKLQTLIYESLHIYAVTYTRAATHHKPASRLQMGKSSSEDFCALVLTTPSANSARQSAANLRIFRFQGVDSGCLMKTYKQHQQTYIIMGSGSLGGPHDMTETQTMMRRSTKQYCSSGMAQAMSGRVPPGTN